MELWGGGGGGGGGGVGGMLEGWGGDHLIWVNNVELSFIQVFMFANELDSKFHKGVLIVESGGFHI